MSSAAPPRRPDEAVPWTRPGHADHARRDGITRARVTQVMGMLRLAPEIQKHILSMPETVRRSAVTERALRPIARLEDPKAQLVESRVLLEEVE